MSGNFIRQDYLNIISNNISNGEIISLNKIYYTICEEKSKIFNTIIKERYLYFVVMRDSNDELLIIGNINLYEKKNNRAIQFYNIVLKDSKIKISKGFALNNIAICNINLGLYDDAYEMLKKCVHDYCLIESLYNLTIVCYIKKDLRRFLRYTGILIGKNYDVPEELKQIYFYYLF